MPLRDHFRPPLDLRHDGYSLLAGWPVMIVAQLNRNPLRRWRALPRVRWGNSDELDVHLAEIEGIDLAEPPWNPPRPTLAAAADLPAQDCYEVGVYAEKPHRLLAAVEIVSPANKDSSSHRRAFVAKCAASLRAQVCVVIVDLVTTHPGSPYADLLDHLELSDPDLGREPPPLSVVTCRVTKREGVWTLETWHHPLVLGRPLPTVPLWLADDLAVPLELEASYEQSCEILGIP